MATRDGYCEDRSYLRGMSASKGATNRRQWARKGPGGTLNMSYSAGETD